MSDVDPKKTIKLKEICRLLDVKERQASYVMERGFVPKRIHESPDRGNHRCFHPGDAFWLGLVLKLKEHGIQMSLAAAIADLSNLALRGITQNLGLDWRFLPTLGRFDTEHEYFLEVGDMKFFRLATDAYPSQSGLYFTDWNRVRGSKKSPRDISPLVTIRFDLRKLASLLKDANWE